MSYRFLMALPLLLASVPALAESLSPEVQAMERDSCLATVDGKVTDSVAYCDCLIGGMAVQLSQEAYVALNQQIKQGVASAEGEAALALVNQLAAECPR